MVAIRTAGVTWSTSPLYRAPAAVHPHPVPCSYYLNTWNRGMQKDSIRFSIRYWPPSNVEYSTPEEGCFGCRIFDIRLCGRSNRKNPIRRRVLRMSNIRHSTLRPIELKKSDPTNEANRICDIRSDKMHTSNLEFNMADQHFKKYS